MLRNMNDNKKGLSLKPNESNFRLLVNDSKKDNPPSQCDA